MSFKMTLCAAAIAILPWAATAGEMTHSHQPKALQLGALKISDAYARVSSPVAKAGAAFFTIENTANLTDRLIAARSDAALRVELHTHSLDANGVMTMGKVDDGFEIPANGSHALARGGDHVMFMGLDQPWQQGDKIEVTLIFRRAGEITFQIPVDLERQPHQSGHAHRKHDS